jgi:hypothetical protein
MSQHYQAGHLRQAKRKSGSHVWEYLWRETDEKGKRVHRTAIVGTVEQYPTIELAWTAANALRMTVNDHRNRLPGCPIPIRDLIDHYVQTDLSSETTWHSHATRTVYCYFLDRWIQPSWGEVALHSVRTLAVEHWLRGLKRTPKRRSATSLACSSIMPSVVSGWSRAGIPSLSFARARNATKFLWYLNLKKSKHSCCSWTPAFA